MTKLELLKKLRALQLKQDAWVDSLPREISAAFFDNPLVDSLYASNQLLMREALGECFEDADWFLNEFTPRSDGVTQIKEVDGTEWSFSDDSGFYVYFGKVCGE